MLQFSFVSHYNTGINICLAVIDNIYLIFFLENIGSVREQSDWLILAIDPPTLIVMQ